MTERKNVLADHRQDGKRFYPVPYGYSEIHYVEQILPEIIWIGYFVERLGVKKGVQTTVYLIERCFFLKDWEVKPDFSLISAFRGLAPQDWPQIKQQLKGKELLEDCLDALAPFVRCYPANNPLLNLFAEVAAASPSQADIDLARKIVSSHFSRWSKEATVVQCVALKADILVGKTEYTKECPAPNVDIAFENSQSEEIRMVESMARCHVSHIHKFYAETIGESWSKYFWNHGRELTPLKTNNVPPAIPQTDQLHPVAKFGLDYERYAWSVVDEIWSQLPVDIYQSELFEVVGALLARQCNLAVKLACNTDLWDYHAGPLFLRPMTDCYITVAWILKDRLDRARKFILYGLGQEKLEIAHLKSELERPELDEEDKKVLNQRIAIQETWLNSQHHSFLQYVDVGSWSGIKTRDMAIEADCLSLFNFAYQGWSHAAHGTWNHIGRFDALPTREPLHKHIWQPANVEHDHQVDIVVQATKYFDKLCVLLVSEFKLQMKIPNPNSWLAERLEQFFAEMKKCNES
jgi:Family of unknown function (DUF5677)